jgi:hypothetical protein
MLGERSFESSSRSCGSVERRSITSMCSGRRNPASKRLCRGLECQDHNEAFSHLIRFGCRAFFIRLTSLVRQVTVITGEGSQAPASLGPKEDRQIPGFATASSNIQCRSPTFVPYRIYSASLRRRPVLTREKRSADSRASWLDPLTSGFQSPISSLQSD